MDLSLGDVDAMQLPPSPPAPPTPPLSCALSQQLIPPEHLPSNSMYAQYYWAHEKEPTEVNIDPKLSLLLESGYNSNGTEPHMGATEEVKQDVRGCSEQAFRVLELVGVLDLRLIDQVVETTNFYANCFDGAEGRVLRIQPMTRVSSRNEKKREEGRDELIFFFQCRMITMPLLLY